jgi:hypothetical protein
VLPKLDLVITNLQNVVFQPFNASDRLTSIRLTHCQVHAKDIPRVFSAQSSFAQMELFEFAHCKFTLEARNTPHVSHNNQPMSRSYCFVQQVRFVGDTSVMYSGLSCIYVFV